MWVATVHNPLGLPEGPRLGAAVEQVPHASGSALSISRRRGHRGGRSLWSPSDPEPGFLPTGSHTSDSTPKSHTGHTKVGERMPGGPHRGLAFGVRRWRDLVLARRAVAAQDTMLPRHTPPFLPKGSSLQRPCANCHASCLGPMPCPRDRPTTSETTLSQWPAPEAHGDTVSLVLRARRHRDALCKQQRLF